MAGVSEQTNNDSSRPPQETVDMTCCLNKILDFSEDQLTCSICSDLMDNPVTVACGHTFCCGCIEDWFQTKQNCPCCREPCPGGEHSDGVVSIQDYLRYLKPLLISRDKEQYRKARRSLSVVITPTASVESMQSEYISDEDMELKRKRSTAMEEYMRERLLSLKSDAEYESLEVALILVKCALAKGNVDAEVFLKDMEQFSKHPERIVEKYMNHPTMTDIDHQYAPKIRKKRLIWEWPTSRSWVQMIVIFFVGVVSYFALEGLEQDGLNLISEPLLRAISLLNVYIDLLSYFQ